VPVYDTIISRGDAAGVIPDEVAGDVLKAAVQESAALALSRRVTMTSKLYRSPVLSLLPQAYWVAGDTGLKQTSAAAFQGLDLTAEEIAVLIPIPEAVLDDASYDVWGELRDPIAQAIAVKLDAAIFAGTEKPASWPEAIIPAAIAASNTSPAFRDEHARRVDALWRAPHAPAGDENGPRRGPDRPRPVRCAPITRAPRSSAAAARGAGSRPSSWRR
jgi:HK97 family phage major capsid protein